MCIAIRDSRPVKSPLFVVGIYNVGLMRDSRPGQFDQVAFIAFLIFLLAITQEQYTRRLSIGTGVIIHSLHSYLGYRRISIYQLFCRI